MKRSRSGRRPGNPDTRESILAAARNLFAERGFDAATMRAIGAEAEVDPALVHHYFGTKEKLFIAAMQFPVDPQQLVAEVTAGGRDEAGARLVRTFLSIWDSPVGAIGASLLRSAVSNEWTLKLLREFLTTQILRRVLAELQLDPAQAQLRASLVVSQIGGLAFARYILKLEPIASLPSEQLVGMIAPNVQRYLTGELDTSGSAAA
ncbi:TetR family transcriptional regulator [Catellatospora sp. KI3]|uniref:TetR/AcrR family transcriptional regulator n=1 Tax=Catellatospora sp. KI3 TaxID=3041620 RepID=UPI0024827F27|nr:TetR family transcriptional regulator [Catellatospora sp. KI3]MDI1464817.1 TetR family transcriptional regulator [Catellatospora sp. KI3]